MAGDRQGTAAHIAAELTRLARQAEAAGLPTLAYLLEMARLEALAQSDGSRQ